MILVTEDSLYGFTLARRSPSLAGSKLLLVLAGIHGSDILEFVFPLEKSLISHHKRRNVQAGLQTCGLQIAYNSHITVCHQNTLAWQDQSHCHPFTFNFTLHEIMPFLLCSVQFCSSPPLFIFPHHCKVTPFSNVTFWCSGCYLCMPQKCMIFISG